MKTLPSDNHQAKTTSSRHLPALTGVRFFAIFHIFLHHLWANYFYISGTSEDTKGLLIGLKDAPQTLLTFMANGWVSTSLFFLLSGFILSFLYWQEDGNLRTTKRHFWLLRFARIYPIHIAVLIILVLLNYQRAYQEHGSISFLISSAVGTAALLQAWIPTWVPMWNWPSWTISAMIFLYIVMPYLIQGLNKLSQRQLLFTLMAMPLISLLPTAGYILLLSSGVEWSMTLEIFFSSFPVFWIPYFVAGLIMPRVFSIQAYGKNAQSPRLLAWGDLAFLIVIGIALMPGLAQPFVFIIRQGLLMPLFIIFLLDLARGKGLVARLLSLPGIHFLGELGFSIFIWQAVVFSFLFWSLTAIPGIGPYQVWIAIIAIIAIAVPSTFWVEKPIAKWIRRKFAN